MTRGFHFDLNTCTGCHACRLACTVENGLPWGESWRGVHDFNLDNDPQLPVFHLSLACNHCDDAPCMASCPALAYRRDDATGAVLIDEGRCIGCSYCSWACPYDAPLSDGGRGVMTKCTLCTPRLAEGRDPACVDYCPTGALGFGGLDAPGPGEDRSPRRRDRTVPGFDEGDIGPRIRFTPLRDGRWRPAGAPAGGNALPGPGSSDRDPGASPTGPVAGIAPSGRIPVAGPENGPARRLSLRSEWPLAAFTLLAAASVGVVAGGEFGGRPLPWPAWLVPAAAGMALSLSHLGRKGRAWRAVLNLRRSWLSREIVAFTLFLALGVLSAPGLGGRGEWSWPAAAAGLFALWCMDRVYATVRAPGSDRVHSAEVFDAGLYFALWLAGFGVLAALVGLYKTVLYLRRRIRRARAGGGAAPVRAAARVVLGFAVPAGLALDRPEAWPVLAFVSALLGETLDRLEFYAEFRLPSPRDPLARELDRRLPVGQGTRQGV